MAETIYSLCLLTSAAVAILLLRGYQRSGERLLLWCSFGFVGFCLNNLMLVADLIIFTQLDLSVYRVIPAMVGMILMVFGLIWESSK